MSGGPNILHSRPDNEPAEIRMRQEFGRGFSAWQLSNHDLKASLPAVLHRRYAVGVIRNENDAVHSSGRRVKGDVEAYRHIDALLFKVRCEIAVLQSPSCNLDVFRLKPPELQHAPPNCEEILARQFNQPVKECVLPDTGSFACPT